MHMSPRRGQAPIVALDPDQRAPELWRILAPERWPLPAESLPAGTVLVGGAVRDGLLGRLAAHPDLDLVVPDDAVSLARSLARRWGGSVVVLDAERSIVRLVMAGWTIDLARRLGPDLNHDLLRRDYSANAIALPLCGPAAKLALVDPSGGLADLAAGRLRAISEANLLDDPLRLLRGVRLACELDFSLEASTLGWIRQHRARLKDVAGERILAELERLAAAANGAAGLALVVETGLLEGCCEALPAPARPTTLASLHRAAAAERGLTAAEASWALPLARLAALLDGASLAQLRASRSRRQRCSQLRRWRELLESVAGDPDRLPEQERFQLQRDLEADLPALALLAAASWARAALPRWRDPADPLFHPRAPIDGATLQQRLGLKPGPRLGQLLLHLSQERAFGRLAPNPVDNDAQTLTVARHWLSGHPEPRHG
jgi:tRNA nucleotidyltransferase (CCA-adding enzyme)